LGFAQNEGFSIRGLIKSPLLGPKGTAEFLVWLGEGESIEVAYWVDAIFPIDRA
jgi:hypothetical protein